MAGEQQSLSPTAPAPIPGNTTSGGSLTGMDQGGSAAGGSVPQNAGANGAGSAQSQQSVPNHGSDTYATTTLNLMETKSQSPDFVVPADYADKPWAQKLKSNEELWRDHANAQELIGRKAAGLAIPSETAPPEEIAAFRKQIGVPETPDGYKYEPMKLTGEDAYISDFLNAQRPEAFVTDLKKKALEIGVPAKMFDELAKAHDEMFYTTNKQAITNLAKADMDSRAEFGTWVEQKWGNNWNQVLKSGNEMLNAVLPAEEFAQLPTLDNKSAMILASAMHHMRQKYIREDKGFNVSGAATAPTTKAEVQRQGRILQAHPAYSDEMHEQHKEIRRQVDSLYEQLKYVQ